MSEVFWCGSNVTHCQVTGEKLEDVMYDAMVMSGRWANIGQTAFDKYGCQLGTGLGQKYERQEDGRWLLVAGGLK